MKNSSNTARVQDIVIDENLPVTATTVKWLEAMYSNGAVNFDAEGAPSLEPTVRKVVAAMHMVLAGAEIKFENGSYDEETFEKLEKLFDCSLEEAKTANKLRDGDKEVLPYTP
jgi:hypothetical protein